MDDLDIAKDRADWLLDAVACATQNRQFLRGDPAYDEVAGGAILLNGEKAINVALSKKDAEITRLRAALADAQAVGFAAGVEAAANSVKRHSDIARGKMSACYGQHDANGLVEWSAVVSHLDIEHDAIRALTPPDAPAAAARVLLGDDIQIARMAAAVHDGPLGADDHWFSAATKQGAWCVDVVRAALRAIAGDTP